MAKEDKAKAFLLSLKRQEEAERISNPTPSKLNVTEEAIKFVETSSSSLDEVNVDLHNPGFFDELFFDELAQGDAHRLKKIEALKASELNVIDDQYFGESIKNSSHESSGQNKSITTCFKSSASSSDEESNQLGVIDNQYFGDARDQRVSDKTENLSIISPPHHNTFSPAVPAVSDLEELSDIDAQYFGATSKIEPAISDQTFHNSIAGQNESNKFNRTSDRTNVKEWEAQISHTKDDVQTVTELKSYVDGIDSSTDAKAVTKQSRIVDEADTARTRRNQTFGVQLLKAYQPNLDDEPAYHVMDTLVDGIIFHDDKIVCINKPYSLHCQGGPGVHHSVHKYLPEIAKSLQYDGTLHLCHRLDKDASGALLLAKGEEQSVKIKKRFESRDIEKTYLAITFGVPKPMSGIIDIPIAAESLVNGNYKSILLPVSTKTRRRGVYLAETAYKVLKHNNTAALVQLEPHTGRKHQLRVHLADGLGTPILGDHKYSHRDKLAPQRLTKDILAKFRLEQSQVRNMPMHLHAQKLVLPNYFPTGKELVLSAKLPEFFRKSIKMLKFFR